MEFISETVTRYLPSSRVLFASTILYFSLVYPPRYQELPSLLLPSLPRLRVSSHLYDRRVSLSFLFLPRSRQVKPRAKGEEKSVSESESRYEFIE